jgi:hypothetical protein
MAHLTLRRPTFCVPLKRAPFAAFMNHRRPDTLLKIACGIGNIGLVRGITGAMPKGDSGWSIAGIAAPASFAAIKVKQRFPPRLHMLTKGQINPGDYHLIIVYYFAKSTIYQLDVAIPQAKRVFGSYTNHIQVFCQGKSLDRFLMANFERICGENERKLCMTIARRCTTGRMRSIHQIDNPYNEGSYIAEVEVGSAADWAENRGIPYFGGSSVFTGRLGEGVVVRLSREGYRTARV